MACSPIETLYLDILLLLDYFLTDFTSVSWSSQYTYSTCADTAIDYFLTGICFIQVFQC